MSAADLSGFPSTAAPPPPVWGAPTHSAPLLTAWLAFGAGPRVRRCRVLGGHRRFPARHSQSAAQGRGRPPPRLAPRKGALSRRREPEEAEGATRDGPARAATAARGRASLRVSQRSARAQRQSREADAGRRRFRVARVAADTALALRRAPPQCRTRVRSPGPQRLREVQRPQGTRGAVPGAALPASRCV